MGRSGKLHVGQATLDLLESPDYSEWDDEELIHMRRRNKRGHFSGRKPKVVPREMVEELHRRVISQGWVKVYATVLPALEYLGKVVEGKVEPDRDRIHTCEVIINRVFGTAPQRVQVTTTDLTPYEKAGIEKAIVMRNVIDAESEELDNPFEDTEGE